MPDRQNLHVGQPMEIAGPKPEDADATLILLHGRGATADNILGVYAELELPTVAAVAPQAANNAWYPLSLLAPTVENQPYLDSALGLVAELVQDLINRGVGTERIALLGFSQGACLATEFVARNPRRYGAVIGLTGGLIGPPNTPRTYSGSLDGTPVFLGTSNPDPYIPYERVIETKDVLQAMGAEVELRTYPGMPHTINEDELQACRSMLTKLVSPHKS